MNSKRYSHKPFLPGFGPRGTTPSNSPFSVGDIITMDKSGPYIVEKIQGPCNCAFYLDQINGHSDLATADHWHLTLSHPRLDGEFYLNHLIESEDPDRFLQPTRNKNSWYKGEARRFKTIAAADSWVEGLRGDIIWHGDRRQS